MHSEISGVEWSINKKGMKGRKEVCSIGIVREQMVERDAGKGYYRGRKR